MQEEESAVIRGLQFLLTTWRPQHLMAINAMRPSTHKGLQWVSAARIGRAIRRKLDRVFTRDSYLGPLAWSDEPEEQYRCGYCATPWGAFPPFRGKCTQCPKREVPGRKTYYGGPVYWNQRTNYLNHRRQPAYDSDSDSDDAPVYRGRLTLR